jgi:hypothetical protein
MGLVVDGLWVGSLVAAMDGETLAAAGVTHVVDLANTVNFCCGVSATTIAIDARPLLCRLRTHFIEEKHVTL